MSQERKGVLKHTWTDEERDIVRREYDGTSLSAARIAQKLGVTQCAVKGQVQSMGIAQQKSPPWSKAELETLSDLIHRYTVPQVAKRMHRSVNAVKVKATRLRLDLRARDDWFTKRDVCEVCGVDHKKVQQWIDKGALKASYHNMVKPAKNGSAMWHIELNDLKRFLINYSGELLGRNVDIQQIIWIVSEGR